MAHAENKLLLGSDVKVEWSQRVKIESPDSSLNFDIEKKCEPAKKVFGGMYRVATVDTAAGLTGKHDCRAIAMLGYDHNNCLWVLD